MSGILPTTRSGGGSRKYGGKDGPIPALVRRLFDYNQMDFEAAFDQLMALMSTEPKRAYISSYYRKQTKNQWARDDPAFLVIQAGLVAVGSLFYTMIFESPSFWGYLWTTLYGLLIDWLLIGFIAASITSFVANRYLRQYHSHTVEQSVEWLYALDVHMNAFHVSFLVTYVLQALMLPLLLGHGFFSALLSNALYAAAMLWYFYITYLGFTALPFLGHTQVYLWYPSVTVASLLVIFTVLDLFGVPINLTRIIMAFHYST
jgi:hypothetical protein